VPDPQIASGELVYLGGSREFTLAGKPLTLTPRERTVLEVLILEVGATVSKSVRGQSMPSVDDGVSADAIEICVHRLRKKLEGSGATIVTLMSTTTQRLLDVSAGPFCPLDRASPPARSP
jgi:two-component system response regulator TctD